MFKKKLCAYQIDKPRFSFLFSRRSTHIVLFGIRKRDDKSYCIEKSLRLFFWRLSHEITNKKTCCLCAFESLILFQKIDKLRGACLRVLN